MADPRTVVSRAAISSSLSRAEAPGVEHDGPVEDLRRQVLTESALLPDSPAARRSSAETASRASA